jgi:hypothetical protein
MAYLTFAGTEDKQSSCFKFIGCNNNVSNSINLISNNTSLISSSDNSLCDTCSFYSGPSDATILAFGESFDTAGSIAYSGGESCGSIAFSGGGESCGSIASSGSSSSSFSGGCSYCC